MKKYFLLLKYLGKETFTFTTFKLLAIALLLSTVVGSTIYVSNIGLLVILKAYNIAVPAYIINFLTMSVGTKCVYGTVKDLVKHS